MKSSKTSFLRNCISGWNVRALFPLKYNHYFCSKKGCISQYQSHLNVGNEVRAFGGCVLFVTSASHSASCFAGK